jgi:uncharacterized protein (TIGR00375 family)
MSEFYADLHIHSRYSRATSKKLTPRQLAAWAGVKGLRVVASGDFTHPGWLQELEEQLEQEDSGLLRLKDTDGLDREIPWLRGERIPVQPRFILCTEISSIYKRGGCVRKIHNLIFFSGLERVKRFNRRLAEVGNLESDGRPILGLDSRDLLEMTLDTDPSAFLIPAHIWTPWFSLFGSKSGFDSLEECFGDLASEITALETGLSSDPEMNWFWSELDRFHLVSNSDAHSGEKLAREANIFSGEVCYDTISRALKGGGDGARFLGTVEFFPEEGKYHLDGHRKCDVVLHPRETKELGGRCPVCGDPVTVGVLHRVLSLADRDSPVQPRDKPGFTSLIPLSEILSEVLGTGPKTKKVCNTFRQLLRGFGSELDILRSVPPDDLKPFSRGLAEGIARMRKQEVHREPGFDGRYGRICVFTPRERGELRHGRSLISLDPGAPAEEPAQGTAARSPLRSEAEGGDEPAAHIFNPEQEEALEAGPKPVLVEAGPGTGKTRTLLGRLQRLLHRGTSPRRILTVTFTRAAARELRERLLALFGEKQGLPRADTLHALAFENWLQTHRETPVLLSEDEAVQAFSQANPDLPAARVKEEWQHLSLAREGRDPSGSQGARAQAYFQHKAHWNLVDYLDLLECWLEQLRDRTGPGPYTHVLVDEIQDLSPLQLTLIRHLLPETGEGFFGIGDPEQSIYSFRGAMSEVRSALASTWPDLRVVTLRRNYRSKQNLLDFSGSLFPGNASLAAATEGRGSIYLYEAQSAEQEAAWIAERAKSLLGGTAHSEADRHRAGRLGPGDIGVLVRFKGLIPPLEKAFERQGIPYAVPEASPFWQDRRIQLILNTVGAYLGIAQPEGSEALDCPPRILSEGPTGLAAYYQDVPPFDHLFWKSDAFRRLKAAYQEQGGWQGLLSWIRLESELSAVRERAQKVRVITMHAAKGLEFETVFLPALEQGIVPFAGKDLLSGRAPGERGGGADREEEKRLFYVALTRARQELYLSRAARRRIFGRQHRLGPSEFLDLLPREEAVRYRSVAHTVKQEKQLRLI